jgi:hypothetical protein
MMVGHVHRRPNVPNVPIVRAIADRPALPRPTKPHPANKAAPLPDAAESRGAVATTVAWMLMTLSCAAAQVVALGMWVLARSAGIPANRPNALLLVSSTLLFVAILTGILALALTPLIYRIRKSRPPTVVTIAAIAIAATPLIVILCLALVPLLNPET